MEEWLNLGISSDETFAKLKVWLKKLKDFADAMLLTGTDESEQSEYVMEILQ